MEQSQRKIGKTLVEILGYKNGSRDIERHVDKEDKRIFSYEEFQRYRNGTFENGKITVPPLGNIGSSSLN